MTRSTSPTSSGSSEEVGDLAVFLASERSRYITGAEIVIDGGNVICEH